MKPKLIVQAKIGQVWYNVYVDTELRGAEFNKRRNIDKPNNMTIGLNSEAYEMVHGRLIHEAVEAALSERGATMYRSAENKDYPEYVHFVFDHQTFQYAMDEANAFVMLVEPLIRAEWRKQYPRAKIRFEH